VLFSPDGILREHLLGVGGESSAASPATDSTVATAGRSLKEIATAAAAVAERRAIVETLRAMKGNKSAVARLLGIDYKTLLQRIKRYCICGHDLESDW